MWYPWFPLSILTVVYLKKKSAYCSKINIFDKKFGYSIFINFQVQNLLKNF